MKVVIERIISKTKSIYNFLLDKKYLVVFFLFVSVLIVFIGSSLAALTPVSSVTIPSNTLSYSNNVGGSWQYKKRKATIFSFLLGILTMLICEVLL